MSNESRAAAPAAPDAKPAPDQLQVDPKDVARIARAAFAGTALEWYDYFLFGDRKSVV